ncbi:uncharacterized protein [Phaseolus vulgaris]|uniref:uncharacterized protein n=1 Tax=Phaseolus vulgaris TaxID=3885 RepID=UPI0035CB04BC
MGNERIGFDGLKRVRKWWFGKYTEILNARAMLYLCLSANFSLKHGSLETIWVWELGKQLGATGGDIGNVMVSLEELEKRDRSLKLQREERELWGDKDIDYIYSNPTNGLGDILTIWHNKFFKRSNHIINRWFIVFSGLFKEKDIPVVIVNVYSSCNLQVKMRMWSELLKIRQREPYWGPKPFRFLDIWQEDKEFENFIKSKWESYVVQGNEIIVLKEKLKMLKSDLKGWNKDVFGHIDKIKIDILRNIQELDMRDDVDGLDENKIRERRELLSQLKEINERNESLLQQKSRALWIKQGDSNSKFFHASIKWRTLRNEIKGAHCNLSGIWVEEPNRVKEVVKEFYKNKMSAIEDIGVRLDNVEFKEISESDNRLLTDPFDEKEIKEAICDCDSHKSPGPDGVTFSFIKNNWCLLEKDMLGAVKNFHREGKIPKGCNASVLTLIRKSENPQSLEEYKPISLVSCLYKILTKVLSNRIKKVIKKVIDGSQSAFLSNRGLLDSVLVVNEVVDDLKRRKKRGVIVKLDFEKAYNSVSWEFLFYMMGRLGFCGKWVQWIRACLESATVSVLVNGSPTKEFKPTRGLRQGDPMAPFLFLIVAQAPSGVCKEITKLQRKLLWGWGSEGRKIAWISWDNICKAKEEGGLGIRSIELFNKALLAKWLWRLGSSECGLWKEVLESKYGLRWLSNSYVPKQNRFTSRWWLDLFKVSFSDQGVNWFNQNMAWEVGSGEKIKFWEDEWLNIGQLRLKYERIYNNSELKDKPIDNFGSWNADGWEWNFSWRRDWFEWEKTLVEEFLSIISQVSLQPDKEDSRTWNDPPSYTFSVKYAYNKLANQGFGGVSMFGYLWNLKVTPSAMFYVWRVFLNRIATKQNLHKRGVSLGDTLCALFGSEEETIAHILLSCKRANMLVVSWMLKVVSPPIVQSIICMNNSFDIWNDIRERFSQRDMIHISDHQKMISSFKQDPNNDEQNHEDSKAKVQSQQIGFTPK